jgi:hypothetical protein
MSLGHNSADDFLFLKMHKKPNASSIGHFRLAVLHVGSEMVVLQYDGLTNSGFSEMSDTPLQEYDLTAKKQGYAVAEMRCLLCYWCAMFVANLF